MLSLLQHRKCSTCNTSPSYFPLVTRDKCAFCFFWFCDLLIFLTQALFRRPSTYKHILGVAKDILLRFSGSTTLKTTAGVSPSMRFFHLATSRLRFDASRSRLDVTRDGRRCPENRPKISQKYPKHIPKK